MRLKLKSGFSLQILVPFLAILLFFGCASIQKPMGGPRDRTPPKLLLATPLNETRNFKATQIKLDFDEYFKLTNQYQEITISPATEKQPEFKIKQKSLIIDFKDTLQKNTTYVINFGKAIADVNESNVLKNFTYVFSTGNHIDSLTLSGNVINTLTQEKEKEATVMLFPLKQDSLLFGKKKPYIFTSTDSSGNFSLANLHEGDYRIYALKEQAANKIYDNEDNELIAFLKKPIHLTTDTTGVQLSLFKQEPEKFRVIEKKFDPDGRLFFTFNQKLTDPGVKINYPAALNGQQILDFSKNRDTAAIYLKNMDFDSISVSFTDKDKILDTVYLRKGRKESFTRNLALTYNINSDSKLKPGTDLSITVNSPIETFDVSRIILLEDSVSKTNFTLTKDANSSRRFTMKYRWRQQVKYQLAFNEGSFVNIYGDKNKRLLKNFSIDKPENYGTLIFHVSVPDSSKSYLVELLNEQRAVVRTDVVKKRTDVIYKGFATGKYRIRVIYDANNNNKWDSGNVRRKRYPESIWLSPVVYTLRANWEAEETIDIPKEQITP